MWDSDDVSHFICDRPAEKQQFRFLSAAALSTAAARDLEAAEYHRAGDEQDDDGDHGAGQVPDAARPVQRVHPVGPEDGKDQS